MPKNLGLYNENLSVPRKQDIDKLSQIKQDKITGTRGQIVGFNDSGEPVAQPPYKIIDFGTQTSGQTFTISTEQMNEMLSDYPPDVQVEIKGTTITLRRYDKVETVAYYSNVMYSQGVKYFVSMQAMGAQATITSVEEIQIPIPNGEVDKGKILVANESSRFDLTELSAEKVSYNNTTSGLTATDVQKAIDEVVTKLPADVLPIEKGGTGVNSMVGTDYSTNRPRGIVLQATEPTSIPNGCIVGVYE